MSAARSTPSSSRSRRSSSGLARTRWRSSESVRPRVIVARIPGCSCSHGWTWTWQSKTRNDISSSAALDLEHVREPEANPQAGTVRLVGELRPESPEEDRLDADPVARADLGVHDGRPLEDGA